jgi:hypothetical protein
MKIPVKHQILFALPITAYGPSHRVSKTGRLLHERVLYMTQNKAANSIRRPSEK